MNHKYIIASALSAVGTLGLVAALGFAQPDGIDPPAGPVADTQPSLATLSQQITALAAGNGFPPNLQFAYQNGIGGNQQDETRTVIPTSVGDTVRVAQVFVTGSGSTMMAGSNNDVVLATTGGTENTLSGLRVPTPVKFRTAGVDTSSSVTVLYWIDGEATE